MDTRKSIAISIYNRNCHSSIPPLYIGLPLAASIGILGQKKRADFSTLQKVLNNLITVVLSHLTFHSLKFLSNFP